MPVGHGQRAYALHLVGVTAAVAVAPRAYGIRRPAPRASRRSLAGVDAPRSNRRPDLYTPDAAEFSPNNFWAQNFADGNQNNNNKNNKLRCRVVRK